MKAVLKPDTASTITLYVETDKPKLFLKFLRIIEELDKGRELTDDDIELRKEVDTYWSHRSGSVQVTMSVITFNTLYKNRKK